MEYAEVGSIADVISGVCKQQVSSSAMLVLWQSRACSLRTVLGCAVLLWHLQPHE